MKTIAILIFAALFPFMVNAELPEWYQKGNVKGEGAIVSIDFDKRVVIIDDQRMQLSNKVQIHTSVQEFAPLGKIESGQLIGYDYEQDNEGKTVITEIWVLNKEIISELDKASNKPVGASGSGESSKAKKDNGYRQPLRVSQ